MDQRLCLRLFTLNGSEVVVTIISLNRSDFVFAFITLNKLEVEFEIHILKIRGCV